jgi:hypothetical protein
MHAAASIVLRCTLSPTYHHRAPQRVTSVGSAWRGGGRKQHEPVTARAEFFSFLFPLDFLSATFLAARRNEAQAARLLLFYETFS